MTVRRQIRECGSAVTARRGVSHESRRRVLFKSCRGRGGAAEIARLGNEPNSRNLVTGPWSDNQSSRRGNGGAEKEDAGQRDRPENVILRIN